MVCVRLSASCSFIYVPVTFSYLYYTRIHTLGLQIAQSRYYLQTLDPKVGTICILGALGIYTYVHIYIYMHTHIYYIWESQNKTPAAEEPDDYVLEFRTASLRLVL